MEVRSDKEHDESKVEEVVHDEVTSHAGGSVADIAVGGEKVSNVAGLHDEEDDPEDGSDDRVHGEGAGVEVVLVPDVLADVVAIAGCVDGVVDGGDDGEGPGEGGDDLVCGD